MKKKGFTLIELLVVIAIIGLLMAIIVPSLRKAKQAAWNIICRNNLRQYGLAGTMYSEDYDYFFPNAWGSIYISKDETGHPRYCQWHDESKNPVRRTDLQGSLWPYLGGQDKSHLCPVFARFARSAEPHQNHDPSVPIEPIFSYSMNGMLGGFEISSGVYNHVLRVRTSDVRSPASVFFFGEENPWNNTSRYTATLNDNALCGTPQHPSNPAAWTTPLENMITNDTGGMMYQDCLASFHKTSLDKRDDGDSNIVYVDGHVDMINWENTYRLSRWTKTMPPLFD